MANPTLQPLMNPHFFQAFLPGSETHLTIPVAFFSKHMEGRNKQRTVKLRSDASDRTWEVKIDGLRLTRGWKDFSTAHGFRIGDIIVFRHEGDMLFHVTSLGTNGCEIQYSNPQVIKKEATDDDEEEDNENQHKKDLRKIHRKKKNLKHKTEKESCFSFDYCFVAKVTASNLQRDQLHLPAEAGSSNALNKRCKEIIVVNEEGKSWTLSFRFKESYKRYYIRGGWRRFCLDNRRKAGDLITFNLVGDGETTPMMCICPEEKCPESELMSKHKSRERGYKKKKKTETRYNFVASSSSRQNQFLTINLTPYNIRNSKLILPVTFTRRNGISRKHKKIILMDKHGVKRLVKLVQDAPNRGRFGLGKGWKIFCEANGVFMINVPFVVELIWEDSVPLLKFCYKLKTEPICV